MISFKQISFNTVFVEIDTNVFNERVITKTFYWLSGDYNVLQELRGNILNAKIEKREGEINKSELSRLKNKVNQDLVDFKTRDIVNQETKNIREILLIKAFANNDDFDDFNLLANND